MNRQGILTLCLTSLLAVAVSAQSAPRARDLGVPFDGSPGKLNAITDVHGVAVGQTTLIAGDGKLEVGVGPVRTGVTAIIPDVADPMRTVFAGWYSQNGNGEMTGTAWVEESGTLTGPVMITNTHSVGVVRDAEIGWMVKKETELHPKSHPEDGWYLPVVAETWDGWLNDINGFLVKAEDAIHALDSASTGQVEEGAVGGGTGMICNEFKGGIGTSSRVLDGKTGGYTVGVLVQCNYGSRSNLRIAGVPAGREIPKTTAQARQTTGRDEAGSIIVIVATDAPLLPNQLKRLARRVPLALGRLGSIAGNGSGDLFLAFSTANRGAETGQQPVGLIALPNSQMNPLFDATIQATEEAVVNAMVAARDMTGRDGHFVPALPHDRLQEVLKKYNRLSR